MLLRHVSVAFFDAVVLNSSRFSAELPFYLQCALLIYDFGLLVNVFVLNQTIGFWHVVLVFGWLVGWLVGVGVLTCSLHVYLVGFSALFSCLVCCFWSFVRFVCLVGCSRAVRVFV